MDFEKILSALNQADYSDQQQLQELLLQSLRRGAKPGPTDRKALEEYVSDRIDHFLKAIPAAESYREKDQLMACEDQVLGIVMLLYPQRGEAPGELLAKIQLLVKLVEQERHLESEVDRIFEQTAPIEVKDIAHLCYIAKNCTDEYQRGRLYAGLVHYGMKVAQLSPEAGKPLADFLAAELTRYLATEERTQDQEDNLELMADVVRYFMNDSLAALTCRLTALERHSIVYYAVDSLLLKGRAIPAGVIDTLARDLEFADMTYKSLTRQGKASLFPADCADEIYLAKSDLVHWLTYPTELGRQPDEIEYLGTVRKLFRKDPYHVFRFRSGSDTLGNDVKNQWLIGWSNPNGGTFSNFDRYADYEKDTQKATLKNIKKKLIG